MSESLTPQTTENLLSRCSECSRYTFLNLRGSPNDPMFLQAVTQATKIAPPLTPNTYHQQDQRSLYWLGPDEWLLSLPHEESTRVSAELHAACLGIAESTPTAITDVSGGYTLLAIVGDEADELVRGATPFDVTKLNQGVCTQTLFAKAQVMMWKPAHNEFRILVRRSFANYLNRWLVAAGAEFTEANDG